MATSPLSPSTIRRLIDEAMRARTSAYAPYSKFTVGSAILTTDGRIFSGCNVENASFGATICAERVAIFKAVSEGNTSISAVAVVADYPKPIPPCGICRQVICEFGNDILVVMGNTSGSLAQASIAELLPLGFSLSMKTDLGQS